MDGWVLVRGRVVWGGSREWHLKNCVQPRGGSGKNDWELIAGDSASPRLWSSALLDC